MTCQFLLFYCRAVKASHILLTSDGNVSLTGLRYSTQLSAGSQVSHSFPSHGLHMLSWLSPEILLQVYHTFEK